MDPRLKLIVKGNPNEELQLLMRLTNKNVIPQYVNVVSKFGDVVSCRILRKHLMMVYDDNATKSLKAPQVIPLNFESKIECKKTNVYSIENYHNQYQISDKTPEIESNVVFGIIDFGFDFTHPDFFDKYGRTRFEKIWVQSLKSKKTNKYGYGRIIDRNIINRALKTPNPFDMAGYHPGYADFFGRGMHGTHVLGIAAASGNIGKRGYACNTPIIAVDMGSNYVNGSDLSLGDSVKLIEGIDFILQQAGNRPCVINMSLGGHGDAHTGQTLVELAINNALKERLGFAMVQSTGNYFKAKCHHSGQLKEDQIIKIDWLFKERDRTPNEIEIWYENKDRIAVELYDDDRLIVDSEPFKDRIFNVDQYVDGVIFHRSNEPNTGKNHINIILSGSPVSRTLYIHIKGLKIENGKYHAYIERDDRGQSHFHEDHVDTNHTIGSICNAPLTIAVGAYDQEKTSKLPMSFSSAGPTVDNRMKPEIIAPGNKILAAKSSSRHEKRASGNLTSKSGSSMAAPLVASLIAKILERKPNINIYALRHYLFKFCNPYQTYSNTIRNKSGFGVIDEDSLIENLLKQYHEKILL